MLSAQYISCVNQGAFVISFSIMWLDQNGNWNTSSWNSGSYDINQTRTSPDLSTIGVASDAIIVEPLVHAVAGANGVGNSGVTYSTAGNTATYLVTGTTGNVQVTLNNGN